MWKGKTLSSSGDRRTANPIVCLALAAELVRQKVQPYRYAAGGGSDPSRQGSNGDDPHCHGTAIRILLATGFVASLARPGGNITGLSTLCPGVKRETTGASCRMIVPKLSRVAIIGTSTHPSYAQVLREIEPTAKAFRSKASILWTYLDSKDIETAFRAASQGAG